MSDPPRSLAVTDIDLELLERLRAGDILAPAAVCQRFLTLLLAWLASRYPNADEHARMTAVHDTLLNFVKHPEAFDPAQRSLEGYLRMAAEGDLRNLDRKEGRHHRGQKSWNSVEDARADGNTSAREDDPSRTLQLAEEREAAAATLRRISENWTDEEKRFLDLMRQEEKDTAIYAAILGMETLPFAEQQHEVKKMRDRIVKRLQRGGRHE